MRHRSRRPGLRVEAAGSVDAQNASTDPCKTTERFCTSFHTPHRRVPFQNIARPEPLRISPLPTDSAEEAKKYNYSCTTHPNPPILTRPAFFIPNAVPSRGVRLFAVDINPPVERLHDLRV